MFSFSGWSWLVDSRAIARKVKNVSLPPASQIKDCSAKRECPNCHRSIDNSDVSPEWPGLPAGVKFDPSEVELLEHEQNVVPEVLNHTLDEFIPTIESSDGICYTHPENLPGARKDGSILHFFHRTTNAYASVLRKRRKVCRQHSLENEDVRWHKTGKTRAVMENGILKEWEKIMVLYQSTKKDADVMTVHTSPRTLATFPPNPPRSQKSTLNDDVPASGQETGKPSHLLECNQQYNECLAGESQLEDYAETCEIDCFLLCRELVSQSQFSAKSNFVSHAKIAQKNEITASSSAPYGLSELEQLNFDTPSDFTHAELPFGSQKSIFDWLDRL